MPDTLYRRPMLIGVNAGHVLADDPNKMHSGISYFYRIDCLLDLIAKTFTVPAPPGS